MNSLTALIENIEKVIVGKRNAVQLAVTCLVAGGHLLIEDIPGTGKTTLAIAISRSLKASFSRIQFTADLLPTDITGVSIYNQETREFEFRKGPIFSNIVLADEINRGTPRVQSGLLEAMNEQQVSLDGHTHILPSPFFVIATQNPLTFTGTYPLLTAQLDRFLLKVRLGYLLQQEEIAMMQQQKITRPITKLEAVMSTEKIQDLQVQAKKITVDEAIYRYIVAIANATRKSTEIRYGISHRGSLSLFNAARAYAFVCGRDYVVPDDVKKLVIPVFAHRLVHSSQSGHKFAENLLMNLLESTPVPV